METILQQPQWPASLAQLVTQCLMWDPKNRPTAQQALNHEYFADAVDPLRPVSSGASRLLGRKLTDPSKASKELDAPTLTSKPSWFRKSLIGKENVPAPPQVTNPAAARPNAVQAHSTTNAVGSTKTRPAPEKRATWTNGVSNGNQAPMPILPTIRPISPLSDAVTAQASGRLSSEFSIHTPQENDSTRRRTVIDEKAAKKIGRQLSVASSGNHYVDLHRQQTEQALTGNGGLASPPGGQRESSSFFSFSHLRKRARRLSGRHQTPMSPNVDDIEATAGCGPWASNRSSMAFDHHPVASPGGTGNTDMKDLDKALQSVRYSLQDANGTNKSYNGYQGNAHSSLKRNHSIPSQARSADNLSSLAQSQNTGGPISSRTRRQLQLSSHPANRYETPDEEEELLDEVIMSAHSAAQRLDRSTAKDTESQRKSHAQNQLRQSASNLGLHNPYPTPSPSANRNSRGALPFDGVKPLDITKHRPSDENTTSKWPTPPYEENEWAAAAAASIYAAGNSYR
jgi:meiosis induction protein kinase IME2/SME1